MLSTQLTRTTLLGGVALGAIVSSLVAVLAVEPVRMIEADGEAAKYWPRWRGPTGQGVVKGSAYPDTWNGADSARWKIPVPGRGNSSPIVFRDRIFLTTAYDDGQRLSLLCYRRSDGKLLWETFVPQQEGIEKVHAKNGHASATPVTDGTRVYASFGTHGLMATDLDGAVKWHTPIGRLENYHGSAGSPVLYRDSLIIYHDAGKTASFVAAYDTQTGKSRWRTPRAETVGWGTPVVVRAGSRDELIVSSQRRVYGYDPADGKELWTVDGLSFEVIPTPVVGHDLVFCSSGRAGPTLAIRPGGSGNVTESHVAWSTPKGSPFVPSGIIVGDALYLVNDMQSIVTAYEAKTGALLFQGRLGEAKREGFSGSPGRRGRQGVLHERRWRDVRARGRTRVQAAAREPARRGDLCVAGPRRRHLVLPDGRVAAGHRRPLT